MNIKNCLKAPSQSNQTSIGLLILRFVVGLAFAFHGWGKIQTPMSWLPPDIGIPGVFQALAAISEFCGGIGWMLGLLSPLWSFGLTCTMAVATYFHVSKGDPFVSVGEGSYEPALAYLCVAILLLLAGPGKFSADSKIFGNR